MAWRCRDRVLPAGQRSSFGVPGDGAPPRVPGHTEGHPTPTVWLTHRPPRQTRVLVGVLAPCAAAGAHDARWVPMAGGEGGPAGAGDGSRRAAAAPPPPVPRSSREGASGPRARPGTDGRPPRPARRHHVGQEAAPVLMPGLVLAWRRRGRWRRVCRPALLRRPGDRPRSRAAGSPAGRRGAHVAWASAVAPGVGGWRRRRAAAEARRPPVPTCCACRSTWLPPDRRRSRARGARTSRIALFQLATAPRDPRARQDLGPDASIRRS